MENNEGLTGKASLPKLCQREYDKHLQRQQTELNWKYCMYQKSIMCSSTLGQFPVWRQLMMHQTTAYLLDHMHAATLRIPLRTRFPINTPANNPSSLSWYPHVKQSITTHSVQVII